MIKELFSPGGAMIPHLRGMLELHRLYILKRKSDQENVVMKLIQQVGGVYLFEIYEKRKPPKKIPRGLEDFAKTLSPYVPSKKWLQMTHEDYLNEFDFVEAVGVLEELEALSGKLKAKIVSL